MRHPNAPMMPKHILLIENDQAVREIISYILQNEGYTVTNMPLFDDLSIIARENPDLILIDEWLAGEPGHRLCLKIKTLEHLLHIPVIILSTSNGIEQIVADCKANAFIRKPFDLDDLVDKVKGSLAKVSA